MSTNRFLLSSADQGYASHITDLKSIELSETDQSSWVQALPMGTYRHPSMGKMVFDELTLSEFERNWRNNSRGQDLDIDLEHKQFSSEAAGWVSDLRIDLDNPDTKKRGLWYKIDWTPLGAKKLSDRVYRYFSTDYFTKWVNPSGDEFSNILNGGALTNRPILKGMQPIVLSEDNERLIMNREALEKLARSHGISVTAEMSDAELQTQIEAAVIAQSDPDPSDDDNDKDTDGDDDGDQEPEIVGATQLSETDLKNPIVRALLSERKATDERLAKIEAAYKLSETNRQLSNIGGKDYVLTPKVIDKLRPVMLSASQESGTAILEVVKEIAAGGIKQLGELGSTRQGDRGERNNATVLSEFEQIARKLSEGSEGKINYADAMEQIATEQPDLYWDYMEAQQSGGNR
ncbi:MAG: phage protease [Chitinophagaceae bacterium]